MTTRARAAGTIVTVARTGPSFIIVGTNRNRPNRMFMATIARRALTARLRAQTW